MFAAIALIAQAAPTFAQSGCDAKTTRGAQTVSTPAATGTDGTGATNATGGSGGNSAGIEQQTSRPPTGQPEETKGLDLKMKATPQAKC